MVAVLPSMVFIFLAMKTPFRPPADFVCHAFKKHNEYVLAVWSRMGQYGKVVYCSQIRRAIMNRLFP